jgi:hypothetical protein
MKNFIEQKKINNNLYSFDNHVDVKSDTRVEKEKQ